ncbi:MAG TPA: DUF3073 domain-containing protein [Sporichthyaceae bacterium]|jgi:hypothetical protein
MGRGRAKAKQTKVARELKYSSGGTDLDRLRAELVGGDSPSDVVEDDEPDEDDPYAKYAEGDEDDLADERRSG